MDQNVVPELHGLISSREAPAAEHSAAHRKQRIRLAFYAAGGLAILVAASIYGHGWWTTGRFMVGTDDAYLQADSVAISPEVAGYIAAVPVQDNQQVAPGQVLARIDDRDYRTALASAQANADAASAGVDILGAQIEQQKYAIAEALLVGVYER